MLKNCTWCNRKFEANHSSTKYCCEKCKKEATRESNRRSKQKMRGMVPTDRIRVCQMCGKQFEAFGSGHRKYCSYECAALARREHERKNYIRKKELSIITLKNTVPQKKHICWKCENSVPNPTKGTGCSWSRDYIPVENWDAKYDPHKRQDGTIVEKYTVEHCPQFKAG